MPRIIYLHGFASSPASTKARVFADRFAAAGITMEAPDLAQPSFRELTITGQLAVIRKTVGGGKACLIGSSLGGYLAALYAARHPEEVEKLVLLAPAFGFARRWAESLGAEKLAGWRASGSIEVMHYGLGRTAELGWALMEDAQAYEDEPAVSQQALIFHGLKDDVVPLEASRHYARGKPNVRLIELDSDHQLLDVVPSMWEEIRAFLRIG